VLTDDSGSCVKPNLLEILELVGLPSQEVSTTNARHAGETTAISPGAPCAFYVVPYSNR